VAAFIKELSGSKVSTLSSCFIIATATPLIYIKYRMEAYYLAIVAVLVMATVNTEGTIVYIRTTIANLM